MRLDRFTAIVACAVGMLALVGCFPETAAVVTPSQTGDTTPTRVPLPRTATALASIDDWSIAADAEIGAVLPQVGAASDGSVALEIEAPVVDEPIVAASTSVPVQPGQRLSVEVDMRALSALPASVGAVIFVGDEIYQIPDLDADWQTLSRVYEVPSGLTELRAGVRIDEPIVPISIDHFRLRDDAGSNLVLNPSFENLKAEPGIANESLVLDAQTATMAIMMAPGRASWSVSNADGLVASGEADLASTLQSVSLEGVQQGYYTFSVTDSSATTVTTPVAIIDGLGGSGVPRDDRFGIGLHVEYDVYDQAARLAESLGFSIARNDMFWSLNEPEAGVLEFSPRYDDQFARLRANDLDVIGIAAYGNAAYGNPYTPDTPAAIEAYGAYAAAAVTHFDLAAIEVFNEFNHEPFNKSSCGLGAECYLPLLASVHDQVRAVDPDIPIVAGATANYPDEWFRQLWSAGGLQYADRVSFHPYEVNAAPDSLVDVLERAQASMEDVAGESLPIWITELGSPSTGGQTGAQGDYLVRVAASALAGGAEKFFWYDLINDSPDPDVHEGNFGLFFHSAPSVAALAPKPSGFAQALLLTQLGGREFTLTEPQPSGVVSRLFGSSEDGVRVIWASDGDGTASIRTEGAVTVVSMDGEYSVVQPYNGSVELAVSDRPIFVRTGEARLGGSSD